jgi:transcription antitermination factor NusG
MDSTKQLIEKLKKHIIKLNQESEYFEIGRTVKITDGPFSNMKGIIECINNNNVVISLMMFEKNTRIEIGKESLEIIDEEL